MQWFLLACALYAGTPADDTLVVAPAGYDAALAEWRSHRDRQGHRIGLQRTPGSAEELQALVRRAARSPWLRSVVIVGDAPRHSDAGAAPHGAPTCYVPAEASLPWARSPRIATDNPYADTDGDAAPNLAVGRIPCRSPDELRDYLRRVVAHETSPPEDGKRRVHVVAAPGQFSPVIDRAVEWVAASAFRQLVPPTYEVDAIYASPGSPYFPAEPFGAALRRRLRSRAIAWVYLGHGTADGLAAGPAPDGFAHVLTCEEIDALEEGAYPTVAALVTCEAGAFDGERDCLAERLLLNPSGPLAVVASTRVSMPYGNSVLGIELLRRLFTGSRLVGDVVADSKRRALAAPGEHPLRVAVEGIAATFTPDEAARRQEVAEHVAMYNLLGDPLLRLPRAE